MARNYEAGPREVDSVVEESLRGSKARRRHGIEDGPVHRW